MNNKELYHFGMLGMKWGVRKYQNKDGTLTPTGKKRYQTRYKEEDVIAKFKDGKEQVIGSRYTNKQTGESRTIDKKTSDEIYNKSVETVMDLISESSGRSYNEVIKWMSDVDDETLDYVDDLIYRAQDHYLDEIFKVTTK